MIRVLWFVSKVSLKKAVELDSNFKSVIFVTVFVVIIGGKGVYPEIATFERRES